MSYTPYHIICTIDNNYVQHCAVMLYSLFEYNPNTKFKIHILTEELSPYNIQQLKSIIHQFGQEGEIQLLNAKVLGKTPISLHVSKATYYRLLIPSSLPSDIDKVLFLDVDIIIQADIKDLLNFDMEDYAIGAAIDPQGKLRKEELSIPPNKRYFNAGILLMNLKKWREEKIAEKIITYINKNHQILKYWDQDALNANLYNDVKFFSSQWNVVEDFFRFSTKELNIDNQKHEKLIQHPKIIHFSSPRKPWHLENNHPYKQEYKRYLQKTNWRNYSYTKDFFKRLPIKYLIYYYVLGPLKILFNK